MTRIERKTWTLRCGAVRYKDMFNWTRPLRVLCHFRLMPRLKNFYRVNIPSNLMQWHKENQSTIKARKGILSHRHYEWKKLDKMDSVVFNSKRFKCLACACDVFDITPMAYNQWVFYNAHLNYSRKLPSNVWVFWLVDKASNGRAKGSLGGGSSFLWEAVWDLRVVEYPSSEPQSCTLRTISLDTGQFLALLIKVTMCVLHAVSSSEEDIHMKVEN